MYVSTSIDGPEEIHTKNRTKSTEISSSVLGNYKKIRTKYGSQKINALPTITNNSFEEMKKIIDHYISIGQSSVFLRPVNYQGFARKKFLTVKDEYEVWFSNYKKALEYIFDYNFGHENPIVEVGLEVAIKRTFLQNHCSYVDMRSPNPAVHDYIVVNYDGDLYPSDEARMLSRIRHVNLKVGNILSGLDEKILQRFNWHQINQTHHDCMHCAYSPFCGVDSVDDLSRYNRIDSPKLDTYFCRSSMTTFDFIFSKLITHDPVALYNFQGHLTGSFSFTPSLSNWLHD